MRKSDFHYELPAALIAQHPPAQRGDSRLLCLNRASGQLRDAHMRDFAAELRAGDLLVFNDTRVIKARLHGRKASGGRVEILIERILTATEPGAPARALAQLRSSHAPQAGATLTLADGALMAEVLGRDSDLFVLGFDCADLPAALQRYGELPLPPYIAHAPDPVDERRYQTIFAREPGAVAAPTAGLHFTEELVAQLRTRGVEIGFVTLHVGAGTFQPLRVDELSAHVMHSERVHVHPELCAQVAAARARGARTIAVGTTVVRALETASAQDPSNRVAPYFGETRLFITPGYRFRAVDALFTNFHLPESSLLMLVCAFAGYAHILRAYAHAVAQRYRFFSYGDAMWIC